MAFKNRKLNCPSAVLELHELDSHYYKSTGKHQVHHTPIFRFLDKAAIYDMFGRVTLYSDKSGSGKACVRAYLNMACHFNPKHLMGTSEHSLRQTRNHPGPKTRIPLPNPCGFAGKGITILQRLGIGFVIQIVAIAVASAVEVKRMRYSLLGIGDVFNAIGLLEFFYDQSPEEMQSLGTTFFTSGIGLGNFLNSFLVTMVDKITSKGGGRVGLGII
ncbi:Protein NRT1/ PTR FAMILY 5.1 [Raphanus sativus]|nr:Protein NRT1/ PTR FAMILY 5.1 [Raphanus sativus]